MAPSTWRRPARPVRRVSVDAQQGSTTAESTVGVITAVLLAGLLLHLVLYEFFEELLGSLFERMPDVAVDLVGSTLFWFLVDLAQDAWWGWSTVAGNSAGWISSVATRAGAVVDATAAALRWVGGPVSAAVPW